MPLELPISVEIFVSFKCHFQILHTAANSKKAIVEASKITIQLFITLSSQRISLFSYQLLRWLYKRGMKSVMGDLIFEFRSLKVGCNRHIDGSTFVKCNVLGSNVLNGLWDCSASCSLTKAAQYMYIESPENIQFYKTLKRRIEQEFRFSSRHIEIFTDGSQLHGIVIGGVFRRASLSELAFSPPHRCSALP